jgi:polyhydroxyalkanoate synthesis regulator phasin
MKARKLILTSILVIMMALLASVVSAQQGGNPDRPNQQQQSDPILRDLIGIVVSETGLDAQQILEQWRDGTSLIDIITANGGAYGVVIAQTTAQVTENIATAVSEGKMTQEQADQILADLGPRITEMISIDQPPRSDNNGGPDNRQNDPLTGAFMETFVEQTGLEPALIMEQLRDSATIGDLLAANNIDANAFAAAVVAKMETQLGEAVTNGRITQEQADQLLATLGERVTMIIENGFPSPQRQGDNEKSMREQTFGIVYRALLEQTGLEAEAIGQQLRDGATLGDILASAGIDEATFVAGVVAQMEEGLGDQITQMLTVPGARLLQNNRPDNNRPGNTPAQDRVGDMIREAIVTQTGLEPQAIREQQASGATIAEILAGAGVDVDVFVAGIVAQIETDIAEAVANGNITQEQADRTLDGLSERLTEMLNNNPGRGPQGN